MLAERFGQTLKKHQQVSWPLLLSPGSPARRLLAHLFFSSCCSDQQPGGPDLCALCCCADINKAELAKHARRVVQRSAHMAAADRGHGLLISLSAHVTVGAAEWTGNDPHDFAFDKEAMEAEGKGQPEEASPLRAQAGISRCFGPD